MCLRCNQDILENESINLDWMFRYSLINDIVKVRFRAAAGSNQNQNKRLLHECLSNSIDLSTVRKVVCYI